MLWNESESNDWSKATLNTYLNGEYYNSLTKDAQDMIGDTKYYLGGYADYTIMKDGFFNYERKTSGSDYYYGSNPNSTVDKISLMYVSDMDMLLVIVVLKL